jgi:cell wall-associated NlpC family hydrolase
MTEEQHGMNNRIAAFVLTAGLVLTVGAVSGMGGRDIAWADEVDAFEAQIAATAAAAQPGASLPVEIAETAPAPARGLGDQAVDASDATAPAEPSAVPVSPTPAAVEPAERLVRYTVPPTSEPTLTTSKLHLPKAEIAIARALAAIGDAESVCDDGKCFNLCDHVAGDIWGYTVFSGYETAMSHWQYAIDTGVAHPGDRNVPLGALVFYETGQPAGHVATYVGNGMIVTNATGSEGANIYLRSADYPRYRYLGWAWPEFHGEETGAAL